MLRGVVWQKLTDVSEKFSALIIKVLMMAPISRQSFSV
jgi:hypothetical protein